MASKKTDDPIAVDAPQASQYAAESQGDGWPQPGQEGFVHPDGTPQSVAQLEANKQAAADRAAAGSIIHGAPLATPGDDPVAETQKAIDRAAEGSDVVDAPGGSSKVVKS
ncbi:MAG: hypothetical protein HOQ45_02435 [Nocardioidaceae bacterium]|nr:hypothetical protein [Dermatophilaceae bacterium]NUR05852.1 hypothetical protein [Nocardioidaceae bacterium]NUR80030.1 hypothetical protein [Dermatophilaceae bacterium]